MKKYLYLLIALFCTLTACTDSNEINIVQQKDVTLNINIAGAYESYNLSNFQNYLGNNKSKSVGVLTFVYDKERKLAQKIVTKSKTFQTTIQSVENLKAGEYEVVTLVTIINDDDDESSAWDIVDEDNLNSLMVTFKKNRSIAYWYEAIGLANTSVRIGDNTNVSISPKPVGCVINVGYENFAIAQYNYFGFESRNNAQGIRLAPNLSNTDRFYRGEYDASNLWGAIGYFYSKDQELDNIEQSTFYTFETGYRPYLFGVAKKMWIDGNTSFDFSIKGEFNFEDGKIYQAFAFYVGYPDYLKTFIGTTSEFNTWYASLDKTINPVFALPCTAWGSSVSYVKSFMKGNELLQDIQASDYGYYMVFEGNFLENYVEYDFVTATDDLESVFIPIYDLDASAEDIENQLIKYGYKYDGYIEGDEDLLGYDLFFNDNSLVGVFKNLIDNGGYTYTMMQFVSGMEDTRSTDKIVHIKNEKKLLPTPMRNKKIN